MDKIKKPEKRAPSKYGYVIKIGETTLGQLESIIDNNNNHGYNQAIDDCFAWFRQVIDKHCSTHKREAIRTAMLAELEDK